MTQVFSGMIIEYEIWGQRGLVPLQGVLKGARSVLERQEAEPPLSFLYASKFDTRKNSKII